MVSLDVGWLNVSRTSRRQEIEMVVKDGLKRDGPKELGRLGIFAARGNWRRLGCQCLEKDGWEPRAGSEASSSSPL